MPKRRGAPSNLSTGVEKRLYPYVLAAGASLLTAAKPADAGVIYVNPIDQTYTNQNFSLDLNNDGTPDVAFSHFVYAGYSRSLWANAAGVLLNAGGKAAALPSSVQVGPGGVFGANAKMAYAGLWSSWGPWAGVTDAYLGLRFQVGPNTHYGWVRMGVSVVPSTLTISATVKDWAYEDRPGVGIHAGTTETVIPEPGTLGLLALGAAGLVLWRRRKTRAQ
ncbi:MAG: PEP-CTERM sorting domain-containing protein [Bryobacterales bacterium]|nr:PEP-CTERM sorting domain-containing protein [Bryobacteraceae bacterium]MDW8129115.1 PEP-CTERM sorting domain-containing protein [Bryobacterales bacterium]